MPGLAVAACAGTGGGGRREPSPATCARAASRSCLGFVEQVARVRSIELTSDVPPEVRQSCTATARMTRMRVICPPVLPAGGVVRTAGDDQLYGPQIVTPQSYSVSINNGNTEGYVHWEFGAIRGPATRLWVFDTANWDALPPKHRAVRLSERDYAGHLILSLIHI